MTNLPGFGDHWYTQGSMIGCAKASGTNCGADAPCCEKPMEPTLKASDQLTYQILKEASPLASIDKSLKALSGNEDPPTRKLRGSATKGKATKGLASTSDTYFRMNPWLAPGHAPVANVCGILGGWRFNNARDYIAGPGEGYDKFVKGTGGPTNVAMPPANLPIPAGTKGTDVLQYDLNRRMQEAQGKSYRTNDNPVWKAGMPQEVSYSLVANHGGGFQFRLCKLDHLWDGTMNEGCFEALDFVGNTSWFKYRTGDSNITTSIPFTPTRVSDANTDGVLPKGSTWTQIALPACAGPSGGSGTNSTCDTPQFENAITDAGFWGYGNSASGGSPAFRKIVDSGSYEIVDTVRVPEGLEGDYVFSWRWDSEQTAQVWTQCSVVTIEA